MAIENDSFYTGRLTGTSRVITIVRLVFSYSATVRLELSSCRVHDSHSRRGSRRVLYANVDQYSHSGRGHVAPLDQ